MFLIFCVARLHASFRSSLFHVSVLYESARISSCCFVASPKPILRQSAAPLSSAPHQEFSESSLVKAARTSSAHPSRGPKPIVLICGSSFA